MNKFFPNFRRILALLTVACLLVIIILWWQFSHRDATAAATSRTPAAPHRVSAKQGSVVADAAPTRARSGGSASFPLLDDPAASAFDRSQPVVRIVHQSWVNASLPRLFSRWSRSFPKCFPSYRYALWSDANNRRLIALHYPWFLSRFDSYGAGVQKSDVSRLFYMYHFGGLYCDLDCECLANFEHLLANVSLAFGAMDGKMIFSQQDPLYVAEGQIENSFMYSRPRHPFFWDLILQLNATTAGLSIMSSGPYHIMKGIHAARKNGLAKTTIDGRPYFTIYPPLYFNPYSWIRMNSPVCHLYGEFTEESLTRCRNSFKGSYVLQYHTQVWDKGRRNVLHRIKLR